jgi:hypothetical protein
MLVEMRHSVTQVLLDRFELGDPPMPGQWFFHQQTSYLVMQRKHRYNYIQVVTSFLRLFCLLNLKNNLLMHGLLVMVG